MLFDCIDDCQRDGRDTSEITSATIFSKLHKCSQERSSCKQGKEQLQLEILKKLDIEKVFKHYLRLPPFLFHVVVSGLVPLLSLSSLLWLCIEMKHKFYKILQRFQDNVKLAESLF